MTMAPSLPCLMRRPCLDSTVVDAITCSLTRVGRFLGGAVMVGVAVSRSVVVEGGGRVHSAERQSCGLNLRGEAST